MTITIKQLEDKIESITGLLFTMPDTNSKSANEIWIKFKDEGRYVFISFENPLPKKIEFPKLVGAGNAVNCSDYKKDNLLRQYNSSSEVRMILQNSINYQSNMDETVLSIIQLFDKFTTRFLHM